jgi:sulfur relay (sulfurtransferase) complex TusBCD TusD component (DsrE family)
MKIGLCIGTSPGEIKTRFALELAMECQAIGHDIELFLYDDGIYNALPNSSVKCVTSKLESLAEQNTPVSVCVNMAKYRGVTERNKADFVEISSLIAFSHLANTSDVLLTTK